MRTPISYYGGKQLMAPKILPLFPEHIAYVEPFAGGLALLFNKQPSKVEVINDTNNEVINFYKVVKTKFKKLQGEIRSTLHSRAIHAKAKCIYSYPDLFNEVERAWALWVNSAMSYSSILGSSWSCGFTSASTEKKVYAKKMAFTKELAHRLELVQIENRDALEVITGRDTELTFYYVDPPYFNSNCGTYKGYTAEDFEKLLLVLSKIKGKFLLSSYPSDLLEKYSKRFKWQTKTVEMKLCVQGAKKNGRRKIEVLTSNYTI